MPVDYWNQFINTDDENIRSPPYNPSTHRADGTPITPECRPGKILLNPQILPNKNMLPLRQPFSGVQIVERAVQMLGSELNCTPGKRGKIFFLGKLFSRALLSERLEQATTSEESGLEKAAKQKKEKIRNSSGEGLA